MTSFHVLCKINQPAGFGAFVINRVIVVDVRPQRERIVFQRDVCTPKSSCVNKLTRLHIVKEEYLVHVIRKRT